MIVEVIAVGTELLLGQIVNTNAAAIGAAMAERGLDAHFQQVVGDNLGRISAAIRVGLDRSDAVVITGGIGPTQDDMTREALAEVTGQALVFSEEYAGQLREWWARRGREMPESNLRQAYHPEGAEMLPNPRGTAPGLVTIHDGKPIFCVPGVPAEMEHLMAIEVLPRLAAASGSERVIASVLLRTWGRPESEVAEILDDLYTGSVNPSLAFLASNSEIKIRMTAKAKTLAEARSIIEPMEMEVRSRLGESIFGTDEETIERVLLRLLSERGQTIGTAESMTGGLVTARLTDLPGSSAVVRGGVVAYHTELKRKLLGLSDASGVVTEEAAVALASGARSLLDVDVAVSVTGSAGPDPLEKPVGTVMIGVATPEDVRAREMRFTGDRDRIRAFGATAALHLARLAIIGRWWRG
ncbi:MAG TPA: competence/damage-inducible protein A [Acidimicrobiia bacterium]|nr:competence/damage-inducible protein A [Acidimicrobiia bacterium]